MAKRPAELEADLFRRSLAVINSGAAYLGDDDVIRGLLAMVCHDAMRLSGSAADVPDPAAAIEKSARACARVFLGMDRRYVPVPKWNAANGGIVPFLKTWCGCDDEDPEDAVTHAALVMVSELFDVADLADQPGVLDEDWQCQVTEIIERYAKLFQGMSPPDQAIFDNEVVE